MVAGSPGHSIGKFADILIGAHAALRRHLACSAMLALVIGMSSGGFSAAKAADCGSSPAPGLDWSECKKSNIMLDGSNLKGANLAGTDLSVTGLPNSNLDGADLQKANLMRAWFTGSTIKKAKLGRVEAYRSGFSKVTADGSTFAGAELERANFSEAQLFNVDFQKAELGRANFEKALLSGANFALANLSRANFSGAKVKGPINFDRAFLFLANIEGIDLSTAEGLQQSQLELACGDDKTKLPPGLVKPKDWPCGDD